MTVAELKQELADADDDMSVVVNRGKVSRFHQADLVEVEIDISEPDGGYREADVFTRGTHRRKVLVIV